MCYLQHFVRFSDVSVAEGAQSTLICHLMKLLLPSAYLGAAAFLYPPVPARHAVTAAILFLSSAHEVLCFWDLEGSGRAGWEL